MTDRATAMALAAGAGAFLHTGYDHGRYETLRTAEGERYVIGRRYRGLFDDADGTFVNVTLSGSGDALIERDAYGAIPLFYSTTRPIVSTDLKLVADTERAGYDPQALAEYLSCAYLTGGKTIYRNVRFLMPDEDLVVTDGKAHARSKAIFPGPRLNDATEVSRLLEAAIDNSVNDLARRFPGDNLLNLSGGTDSTLLLAKLRERDPGKAIHSSTYFHDDWRDDLDDWRYAAQAAQAFGSRHRLVTIGNERFARAHRALLAAAANVFHTYAAAFYEQSAMVQELEPAAAIVNGSGPDESIIGTEKIPVRDLLQLRGLERTRWIDHLIADIDYIKLPETAAVGLLRSPGGGFVDSRRELAARLMDAPDFVEFQRRYHAITVLQDHILELSAVARTLDRPIVFPYLTNDVFRIVFSAPFDVLNAAGVYKSVVKGILEKFMPQAFVHRRKIGFQSPSRPYFMSGAGLGRELPRLLAGGSALLDLGRLAPQIRERLAAPLDLHRRYDFLEWTAYNILLLEESRGARA